MNFNPRVICTFFISRVFVICLTLIGTTFIGESGFIGTWNIQVPFFNLFARWDSAYYMLIAKSGYSTIETFAFRPLFPVLLNLVSSPFSQIVYIDIAIAITGFFLNNILFLIALFGVHKLTTNLFSKEIADDTIMLLAFYPAAFFYSAIYSESLYLLLIVISFLFLEKTFFLTSGIFGFLAGLTRPEGMFSSIVIFMKSVLATKDINQKDRGITAAFIAGTSILVFAILAWNTFGDFGVIFTIQSQWDKVTLLQAFNHPSWIMGFSFISFFTISLPMIIVAIATIFPFFISKSKNLKDETYPYYVHAAFLVIFFLVVGDIRSLNRYFATLLPIFWTLSLWIRRKPCYKIVIMLIFSAQLALGTILFVNWYHFI